MKKSLKESEVLRVELEEVKRRLKEFEASLQLKDEEISRLFDEAKGHFAVGVNSPLVAIKSKLQDFDLSSLDRPLDQALAPPIASTSKSAPGFSVPPPELASSAPASASPVPSSDSPPFMSCLTAFEHSH